MAQKIELKIGEKIMTKLFIFGLTVMTAAPRICCI